MHAPWNSGTSSPNLLEVPTMDSGHCHLELLPRALKAGHQDSMHLTVSDLLSEPLKVFCPVRKCMGFLQLCVWLSSFMCMNVGVHVDGTHVRVS